MKHGDHFDYQVRQWILDSAISANRKGASATKIVSDAKKFYGFVFPENGKVVSVASDSNKREA